MHAQRLLCSDDDINDNDKNDQNSIMMISVLIIV